MNLVRIVLADDHTLVRAGLSKLIETIPGFQLVGQADDGRKALELAEQLQPDLVLMDLSMPELSGLEVTARLNKTSPKIKVIILSMHQNDEYVRQAMRNGAAAYLLKDAHPRELEQALHDVLDGKIYLSSGIEKGRAGIQPIVQAIPTQALLTARQTEVLRLIAQGFSSKEIARELKIAIKTVDTHRTNLMQQLDIHEITGLVRYAIRIELIVAGS